MKKAMTIMLLVLIATAYVFASPRVSLTFDPFSFQHFMKKEGKERDRVNSTYGIGAGLGFDWEYDDGFRSGFDVKFDTYSFEELDRFTDVSILAKGGYAHSFNEETALYGNMKLGLDIQTNGKETSAVFEFGPELGFEYACNDKLKVFTTCEFLFGFPEGNHIEYFEFRFTPALGIGYSF